MQLLKEAEGPEMYAVLDSATSSQSLFTAFSSDWTQGPCTLELPTNYSAYWDICLISDQYEAQIFMCPLWFNGSAFM